MPKPYLVSEIRYGDGRIEKTTPEIVGNIISARSSKLITGMLISVVEKTYWRTVKIPEYYIAGKTGTAQIPGQGGYTDSTNHTFSGYFPAGNPQFVMIVKYEAPQRQWAEGTAGPVFKDVADFTLKYYGIKAER
jgi:cell division protein FtsI/penicillin-binding protein 2